MISKFMLLDSEKRQQIVDAAMEEFAQKGYRNASTNAIVKKANIAKGLLFHYFTNKQGLFEFLFDYAWQTFMDEFYSKVDLSETDLLRRLQLIIALKIELTQRHPDLYDFIMAVAADDSAEAKAAMDKKYQSAVVDGMAWVLRGIDTSHFRDGVDISRVMQIIMWVVQGLTNREVEQLKTDHDYRAQYDIRATMGEVSEYVELLTTAFYD